MMKRALFLVLILLLRVNFYAFNATAFYNEGNKFYLEGKYKKALTCYQKIIEAGIESPQVYYNLGNVYFKLGKIGWARYYWEKTLQLNDDEDARQNIEVIKKKYLKDNLTSKENTSIFKIIYNYFNYQEWKLLFMALTVCLSLIITFYILSSHDNWKFVWSILTVVIGILWLMVATNYYFKVQEHKYYREAIVISEEVEAKSEPSSSEGETIFKLHEATKVKIGEERNGWYKVIIGKNIVGWIKKDSLKVL